MKSDKEILDQILYICRGADVALTKGMIKRNLQYLRETTPSDEELICGYWAYYKGSLKTKASYKEKQYMLVMITTNYIVWGNKSTGIIHSERIEYYSYEYLKFMFHFEKPYGIDIVTKNDTYIFNTQWGYYQMLDAYEIISGVLHEIITYKILRDT